MAAQAALEIQRRRKCELEAQMKAAVVKVAPLVQPRMELPRLEKRLDRTLLDKAFRPGGRGR